MLSRLIQSSIITILLRMIFNFKGARSTTRQLRVRKLTVSTYLGTFGGRNRPLGTTSFLLGTFHH
jgi:hypothetical protein